MTAIRAWARRGLASDPDWYPLTEGHELASLALVVHYGQGDISNAPGPQKRIKMAEQPLYELIFLYVTDSLTFHHHFPFSLHSPLQTSLHFQDSGDYEDDTAPLRTYNRISQCVTLSNIDKESSALSNMFFTVVRNVMEVLDVSGALLWKGEASTQPSEQVGADIISWVFSFNTFRPPEPYMPQRREVSFRLQRSTDDAEYRWTLLDHDLIAALLALSAHALARKLEHRRQNLGGENLSIGDELFFVGYQVRYHPSSSGRIVGSISNNDSSSNKEMLEQWLDANIGLQDIRQAHEPLFHSYLGVFLSSASEYVSSR